MNSWRRGAEDLANDARAVGVNFADDALVVNLDDGRIISAPLEWFPSLRDATATQRQNFRLVGSGTTIHRMDLNESLSVKGLLQLGHLRYNSEKS